VNVFVPAIMLLQRRFVMKPEGLCLKHQTMFGIDCYIVSGLHIICLLQIMLGCRYLELIGFLPDYLLSH